MTSQLITVCLCSKSQLGVIQRRRLNGRRKHTMLNWEMEVHTSPHAHTHMGKRCLENLRKWPRRSETWTSSKGVDRNEDGHAWKAVATTRSRRAEQERGGLLLKITSEMGTTRNDTVPWGADEGACGCRSLQAKHPRMGSWENGDRVKMMEETWRRADCNWRLPETSVAGKSETWRGDVEKRRFCSFYYVYFLYFKWNIL